MFDFEGTITKENIEKVKANFKESDLGWTVCDELTGQLGEDTSADFYELLVKTKSFKDDPVSVLSLRNRKDQAILHSRVEGGKWYQGGDTIVEALPADKIQDVLKIKGRSDVSLLGAIAFLNNTTASKSIFNKLPSDEKLDVNTLKILSQNGNTALHQAIGNTECLEMMLQRVDALPQDILKIKNNGENTVLHLLSDLFDHIKIVEQLHRDANYSETLKERANRNLNAIFSKVDSINLQDGNFLSDCKKSPDLVKAVLDKYKGPWSLDLLVNFIRQLGKESESLSVLINTCPKELLNEGLLRELGYIGVPPDFKIKCVQLFLQNRPVENWDKYSGVELPKYLPGEKDATLLDYLAVTPALKQEYRKFGSIKACKDYLAELEFTKKDFIGNNDLLVITQNKINVINDAMKELSSNEKDCFEKFQTALCKKDPDTGQMILAIRRDSMLQTFLKAIAVALTLGTTYHKFFGEKSTKGLHLIADMRDLMKEPEKTAPISRKLL